MSRRRLLGWLAGLFSAHAMPRLALGADGSPATPPLTVDFHSHAWRRATFATDLRQGGVDLIVLNVSSDRLLLKRDSGRQRAIGSVQPGVLHANSIEQLASIKRAIASNELIEVHTPGDAHRARAAGKPGIILGFEGADVLEGSPERLREVHSAGARLLQLVHFRVNELGDIQTEDPVHGGLTAFGAETVRTCNRLGIIVDLAHATLEVTRQSAQITTRPLLLSHTYLRQTTRRYTRGITREHAKLIAATDGLIGVVPFPNVFASLQDYVTGIARMVDAVGVNHVGIGGDLAGIAGSPPYRRFEQFPQIVDQLRQQGFSNEDVAKIAGMNFMRLFAAVAALD